MNLFTKIVCVALISVTSFSMTADAQDWRGALANAAQQSSQAGIMGQCHVDSRVGTTISVYINGVYRGTMGSAGDLYLNVGDFAGEATFLRAVGADGRVWNSTVTGAFSSYHWILN